MAIRLGRGNHPPRTAIIDRLERLAQPDDPQYLFLDPALVPEPNLCYRGNLDNFKPQDEAFNVFVLSPQAITGGDRRFAKESEFRGASLAEYLREVSDLVVFTDEAHHLGTDDQAAWTKAINLLRPRLHFGLTATPRVAPGVNVVHSYDLNTCLQEGLYTKAVNVVVDPRDDGLSEEEWDRHTVDYALRRLERKREAIRLCAERVDDLDYIEPVALICAKDIDHAEEIAAWLVERRGFDREELLLTHSQKAKTEAEIARLVAIDKPGNRIKIVVNVFQLTEGWDVTNVFVIAPLRAMATFQGAVQTMGRGLRLPAGRRVNDPDVDTLDVLCFGRETLEGILHEATETFGVDSESGPPVDVTTKEEQEGVEPSIPRKPMTIRCIKPVNLVIPNVRQVPVEPPLDFDLTSAGELGGGAATVIDLASLQSRGVDELVEYDLEDVVRIAAARVVAQLRYLSDFQHGGMVEALLRGFLESLGAAPDQPIRVDPLKLAVHVRDEIDRRYRTQASQFELAGEPRTIVIGDVTMGVPDDLEGAVDRVPIAEWTK